MLTSQNNHEIVIALVAPIGVDIDEAKQQIQICFENYKYQVDVIAVAALGAINMRSDEKRLCRARLDGESINMPDKRKVFGSLNDIEDTMVTTCDIYPYLIVEKIRELRKKRTIENSNVTRVYILDSIKNPLEIESLRRVYKKALFVVGLTAPVFKRIQNKSTNFMQGIDVSTEQDQKSAISDILDDYSKPPNFDKKIDNATSDAYHLSDVFINFGLAKSDSSKKSEHDNNIDENIERFVDLVCGAPTIAPCAHEHNMFMAYMSSIRSADLSRQVGSTIVNQEDDIIAMGANEVPKAGGGQYWSQSPYVAHIEKNKEEIFHNTLDQRDYALRKDANAQVKNDIIEEIIEEVVRTYDHFSNYQGMKGSENEIRIKLSKAIKETSLGDLTEFGRVVHAEMSALMTAARLGISVKDTNMYCTTYPCHNCAKHIVASGIKDVFYIEPYPKSKANKLHKDAIIDLDAINHSINCHEYDNDYDTKRKQEIKSLHKNYKDYLNTEGSESNCKQNKVRFLPYSGVGPKRYLDLFSMHLGDGREINRKDKTKVDAELLDRKKCPIPRIPVSTAQIAPNEQKFIQEFKKAANAIEESIDGPKCLIKVLNISNSKKSFIKFWDPENNYGYILGTDKSQDYKFHLENVTTELQSSIKSGIQVSFDTDVSDKGSRANNIKKEQEPISSEIKYIDPKKSYGYIAAEPDDLPFRFEDCEELLSDESKGKSVTYEKAYKNRKIIAVEVRFDQSK